MTSYLKKFSVAVGSDLYRENHDRIFGEKLTCDDCAATYGVEATTCPYAAEIHDEHVPMNLCADCYGDRLGDT